MSLTSCLCKFFRGYSRYVLDGFLRAVTSFHKLKLCSKKPTLYYRPHSAQQSGSWRQRRFSKNRLKSPFFRHVKSIWHCLEPKPSCKTAKLGLTGKILGWLLTESMAISQLSDSFTRVPQGAMLGPLLSNNMLSDLPSLQDLTKLGYFTTRTTSPFTQKISAQQFRSCSRAVPQ